MAAENTGEHLFLWQIENFSACTEVFLVSPVIRARDFDDSHWNLMLAPRGKKDGRFIGVHLLRPIRDHAPTYLHLEVEACLIDVNGEERFKQHGSCTFRQDTVGSFNQFVTRSLIFEDSDTFLPNDVLTLLLRVRRPDRGTFSATRTIACSRIRVERSAFLWTIRGLTRSAIKRVVHVESSAVTGGLELSCECANAIEERNDTPGSECVLRLAIKPRDVPKDRIFVSAAILAQGRHSNALAEIESEHFFGAGSDDTWHLPSIGISDGTESLQDGDRLDLVCDFSISDGSQDNQIEGTLILLADNSYTGENTLLQDIRHVYENTLHFASDILLVACNGGQQFRAHKLVLSARSVIFREILNRFDVEKKRFFDRSGTGNGPATHTKVCVRHESIKVYAINGKDYAQIFDTYPDVLAQTLKCMYTDTLNPGSLTEAMQLYSAGVQIDFGLLLEKSEMYLKSKISLPSVYEILVFAHVNEVVRLKWECLNFISKNREFILCSDWWLATLRKRRDGLTQEIWDVLESEESSSC